MSHFVYHPNHPAKVVSSDEYEECLANGWYDTPAKFPKKPEQGLAAPEVQPEIRKKGRPPKNKVEDGQDEPDDAA